MRFLSGNKLATNIYDHFVSHKGYFSKNFPSFLNPESLVPLESESFLNGILSGERRGKPETRPGFP
jgi:hypothetical protein